MRDVWEEGRPRQGKCDSLRIDMATRMKTAERLLGQLAVWLGLSNMRDWNDHILRQAGLYKASTFQALAGSNEARSGVLDKTEL